jgi:phage terminase large subunit-like protein
MTWDNLVMGSRLVGPKGDGCRIIITTTPKPLKVLKDISKMRDTVMTGGSTYDNLANLDKHFQQAVLEKYEGTSIGRQEIYADILTESSGAHWNRDMIEATRVKEAPEDMERIVVGVDPQAKDKAKRKQFPTETGIIVAGISDGHIYIMGDRSLSSSPDVWGRRVVGTYEAFNADRIIAEVNQGGDMVEHTLRVVDKNVPIKQIRASKGKWTRAEPIAALYEQNKIHHIGVFPELEDQMCAWSGEDNEPSPDRLDALVWACSELGLKSSTPDISINTRIGRRTNPFIV